MSYIGAKTGAFEQLFKDKQDHRKQLTVDESQEIADAASEWEGTKYATQKSPSAGPNAEMGVKGDCSGIIHAAYEDAGYDYPY